MAAKAALLDLRAYMLETHARLRRSEERYRREMNGQYITIADLTLPQKRKMLEIPELDPGFDTEDLARSYASRKRVRGEIEDMERSDAEWLAKIPHCLAETQDAIKYVVTSLRRLHVARVSISDDVFREYLAPLEIDFIKAFKLTGQSGIVFSDAPLKRLRPKITETAEVLGLRLEYDNGQIRNTVVISKGTCWWCKRVVDGHAIRTQDDKLAHVACMWFHNNSL